MGCGVGMATDILGGDGGTSDNSKMNQLIESLGLDLDVVLSFPAEPFLITVVCLLCKGFCLHYHRKLGHTSIHNYSLISVPISLA